MSNRGYIVPNVTEIKALGVEIFLVPTIVLDILAAMSAHGNRNSHCVSIEDPRHLPFYVIKQPVVTRRQTLWYRQAVRFVDRYPVLERKCRIRVEMGPIGDQPFRQVVNEKGTTWCEDSCCFIKPRKTPSQ